MKQQEILKKIGNILKELNEQYEYLQAQEAHINDLELELFAANAKFLTDHNEILRKINAQYLNVIPALPEHQEPAQLNFDNNMPQEAASSVTETNILPPLFEDAVTYQDDNADDQPHQDEVEIETLHHEHNANESTTHEVESEPFYFMNDDKAVSDKQPEEYADNASVEQPIILPASTEHNDEHNIAIEPAYEHNEFSFVRNQPQVSEEPHAFELQSSYSTEETTAPPHVDLTAVDDETHAEKAREEQRIPETYESILEKYGQPLSSQPVESASTNVDSNYQSPEEFNHAEQPEASSHQTSKFEEETANTFAEREVTVPIAEEKASVLQDNTQQHTEEPKTFHTQTPAANHREPEAQPLSLHERLAAQLRGESVSNASTQPQPAQQQSAVTDVKSAINLNDRMLFVKELFNGYGMAYNEAIEILNRCKNFEEADKFLKMNYVTKNHWTEKPSTVDKFYAVLRRRFPQ
ncbi:hypothetical protein [Mucilaginibacter aquatilis]|uniref:Uncharacterized protein n=1 Tax=Mucilaginibacter aquatilis TaxID=1517760 RepID=A0A6I4IH35_9SPHI|nr:hypothetical protein [Mucilaginibacter aquatilis]MVN92856.1 hypothetical protein [Mucilaginibacter aquatilis]